MEIMSALHSCFDSSPGLNDFQIQLQSFIIKSFLQFIVNSYLLVFIIRYTRPITEYKNFSPPLPVRCELYKIWTSASFGSRTNETNFISCLTKAKSQSLQSRKKFKLFDVLGSSWPNNNNEPKMNNKIVSVNCLFISN